MKNKETRLSYKLDTIFWWILRLLPLMLYVIYCWGGSRSEANWQYVVDDSDSMSLFLMSLSSFISESLSLYPSSFFIDLFVNLFGSSGIFPLFASFNHSIFVYLSYCVSIEILRMMYNVIVFFIRWAYRAIENLGR